MARRAVHTPAVPRVAFVDATSVDYAAAEQYAPNPCLFGHPSLYSHPVVTPRDARCAPPRTPSPLVAFPMGAGATRSASLEAGEGANLMYGQPEQPVSLMSGSSPVCCVDAGLRSCRGSQCFCAPHLTRRAGTPPLTSMQERPRPFGLPTFCKTVSSPVLMMQGMT